MSTDEGQGKRRRVLAKVRELIEPVAITVIALIILCIILSLIRGAGWKAALDPVTLLEDLNSSFSGQTSQDVNVEVRDVTGDILDFDNLVPVLAHNGEGPTFKANHGILSGSSKYLHVGGPLEVTFGELKPIALIIKYDDAKHTDFVAVPYTRADLLHKVNRETN